MKMNDEIIQSFNKFERKCKYHKRSSMTSKCFCEYDRKEIVTCNKSNCPFFRVIRSVVIK